MEYDVPTKRYEPSRAKPVHTVERLWAERVHEDGAERRAGLRDVEPPRWAEPRRAFAHPRSQLTPALASRVVTHHSVTICVIRAG